jgi:hypothetical protein
MKIKIGHELRDNVPFKFSCIEEGQEPDFTNEKINEICLNEVFELDKFFYPTV